MIRDSRRLGRAVYAGGVGALRWAFGPRHWPLAAATAFGGLWLATVPRWTEGVFADPLDVPLPLAPRGAVERAIEVRVADRYQLRLRFPYADRADSVAHDSLRQLVGGMHRPPRYLEVVRGVGVPVRWSLRDARTGAPVAGGDTVTYEADGWSALEVDRGVATVRLPRGRYRLRAEVLDDVPAFAAVPTRLVLGRGAKDSESGVVGLAWWASLLTYLVRPAPGGAAALLALQAAADAWGAGAARRRGVRRGPTLG